MLVYVKDLNGNMLSVLDASRDLDGKEVVGMVEAHWNNEAEAVVITIDVVEDW